MRISTFLPALAAAGLLSDGAWAQGPSVHETSYLWGGETREVFSRVVNGDQHVWTVGDGALIRHAIDPEDGGDWEYQDPPAGVTQTLLDVYFLPNSLTGWACGVGGHIIKTVDGGDTWEEQAPVIDNEFDDPGTIWGVRFNEAESETHDEVGFCVGLWLFKIWDGLSWSPVQLEDENGTSLPINEYEFYALDMITNPSDSSQWIAVAAGQRWSGAGGTGAGKQGEVFYTNSSALYSHGARWERVLQTLNPSCDPTDPSCLPFHHDPWDFEFEPAASSWQNAVGYLVGGTGFTSGYVYRCTQSGLSWQATPELYTSTPGETVNTIYGISVIDADHAVAVSYGAMIWYRTASGWSRVAPQAGCSLGGTLCDYTAPLAGAHTSAGETFAVGAFGYVRSSPDAFTSTVDDLNSASPENMKEQLRLEDVHFTDSTHGFIVGANRAIASCVDGGTDFDLVYGGPSASGSTPLLLAIDLSGPGRSAKGVAVGESGGSFPLPSTPSDAQALAYYSSNGGSTWSISDTPALLATNSNITAAKLVDVSYAPGRNAFVAVGNYTESGVVKAAIFGSLIGQVWSNLNTGSSPVPSGVILTAVAFGPGDIGFAVGYDASTLAPRAYKIDLSNLLNPITSISPSGTKPLRDVATNGTNTYAVADGEEIYTYNGTGSMTQVSGALVPDLNPGGRPFDLISVAVAPEQNFVLIGAEHLPDEDVAPGLGKLLLFDGTNWSTRRALTCKGACAVQLLSSESGWVLGRSSSIDPEFGQVNDSILLRFTGPF